MKKVFSLIILAVVAGLIFAGGQGRPGFELPAGSPEAKKAQASEVNAAAPADSGPPSADAQSPAAPAAAAAGQSSSPARVMPNEKTVRVNDQEYPLRTYRPMSMPNDPSASQWWVTQSKLDQSWDVPAGLTQTVLAVIDTGFALNHEEFDGRWYTNSGESGVTTQEAASALNCADRALPLSASCNLIDDNADGVVDNESGAADYQNPSRLNCTALSIALDKSCNRLDDDANGHVDDRRGWDFTSNDNAPQAGELNPAGDGTTHGTKVAGIAAATGDNAKGIAGVDWNTKILPIQALDDDSYGDTLSVGRAIHYAIEQGADVISISLGSDLPDGFVRDAVQDALAAGIVVVAAAGNDGCDCMVYPAAYPEVLAVGALDTSSQPAYFSSYGSNLDLIAPGTNMTSATWQAANQTAAYAGGLNGTSFATPFVGGMLTRLKSSQPTATPAQLIAALTENVNRLSLPAAPIVDPYHGFGTVDAAAAASRMHTPKTGQFSYVFSPISRGDILIPASPVEPVGSTFVYACEDGRTRGTAVHELIKGYSHFFTISKVENQRALESGYTSTNFAYACLRQPHDSAATIRNLNIYKEFRNDFSKPN